MSSTTPRREAARAFRDLTVWRKAHEFVLAVYKYTSNFPRQETYGLTSQMRRAAVSIPATSQKAFAAEADRTKPAS